MGGDRHITRVALNLIVKLAIRPEEALVFWKHLLGTSVEVLERSRWSDIQAEIEKMRSETLGRILAQAPSSDKLHAEQTFYPTGSALHGRDFHFPNMTSGRKILQYLAALALITEMACIFRSRAIAKVNARENTARENTADPK